MLSTKNTNILRDNKTKHNKHTDRKLCARKILYFCALQQLQECMCLRKKKMMVSLNYNTVK